MTTKQWLLAQSKLTYVMTGVVIVLAILFGINKCNSKRQQNADIDIRILQSENKALQANNTSLKTQLYAHKQREDSLWELVLANNERIALLNKKVNKLAANYATEIDRLEALPDDEAVVEFLDNSNCPATPILKHDSSYMIPICPIRTYNNIKAGYDMQTDVNLLLQKKVDEQSSKIYNLSSIVTERGNQISLLDSINGNHLQIETGLTNQVKAEHSKYKAQKRKTILVGIAGGVLLVGSLILP